MGKINHPEISIFNENIYIEITGKVTFIIFWV